MTEALTEQRMLDLTVNPQQVVKSMNSQGIPHHSRAFQIVTKTNVMCGTSPEG